MSGEEQGARAGAARGAGRIADVAAIVLAGGRGSRLGGVDKAAQLLAGERLVDRTVAAARAAGATRVVVVGPESAGATADAVVRERPEYGGPLAALAAGVAAVDETWLWVLACDLEHPELVCTALARAAPYAADGVLLVDDDGRAQWLAGCYRRAAVASVCDELGARVHGAPVRRALSGLELRRAAISNEIAADIDTADDLAEARARADRADRTNRAEVRARIELTEEPHTPE